MPKPDEAVLFTVARQMQTAEARRRYLQEACGDDHALRVRVEALLRVHEEETSFLRMPAVPMRSPPALTGAEVPGVHIGPYKLLEQIGEGGFGVVFLAEQQQPLRRLVALKILKPGMDTRLVVARFAAERQALALMDHPNIARVLDGGETATGRPYFIMELVKGVPITEYCAGHQLSPRARLGLFVSVCRAVQHAHQKGIIHRDLKPGNVLVAAYDGRPVPKVIDFGVAKALGQPLTEFTLTTASGGMIGTLGYMSPEQAEFNARDIDTRADIYSLGVLLYELLTGTTPLTEERLKQTPVTEALRLIREEEPPRPSARLSEARTAPPSRSAFRPRNDGRELRELRGDLDWIVMKALDKDRDRRYQSASGLARDVERYLNGERVEACPPSLSYKLRKFARKNRKLLVVAAAFVLLLSAATASSVGLAVWATLAERSADEARDRAEAEARRARGQVYAAHMNLGQTAWEENRVGRLVALLEQHRPERAGEELRGFEWYYWRRLADTALLNLKGHDGLIWNVTFSPDGRRLASAGNDQTVRVWDAAGGREALILRGHGKSVAGVAFRPDGQWLASAGRDGTIKLWDAVSGRELRTLRGHTRWVTSVAFSPGGERLASSSHDGTVRLWDTAGGRELGSFPGHTGAVSNVVFSPDGKWLASAGGDRTVKIWDTAGGREVRTLRGHTEAVTCVAFSPDGKWLASAGGDRTVKLWDAAGNREPRTLQEDSERVFSVAFSPDGRRLVSAGYGRVIRVWDVAGGQETMTLKGHTDWISSATFHPDGRRLASAGRDGTVKVWNVATGQETTLVMWQPLGAMGVAFSPDGKCLALAGADGVVSVYDAASGLETTALHGHGDEVTCVAFSPDGKWLASGSRDKTVRVWDAARGQPIRTLQGPTDRVRGVGFSPDGTRLAAASDDKTICVWDLANGQETLTLRGHTGVVTGVAFSPDGKRLASSGGDGQVKLWNAVSGQEALTFVGVARPILNLVFSPDGRQLAAACADHSVRTWNAADGQPLFTLEGHTDWVSAVAFSPDGKRLASASADKTVKVWDAVHGHETLTLKGHTHIVAGVAFSPEGARLASTSYDHTVRMWDARPWTAELRVEQEARCLVHPLLARLVLKAEAIPRVERDAALSAEVRGAALEMITRSREDPYRLNAVSWNVVARSNQAPESYALALRQAEAACRLEPENWSYLNTLGVALYRNGKFAEAIEALTRGEQIRAVRNTGRNPSDVAFLAMAQFKLGRRAKARDLLTELCRLMQEPRWSGNAEDQGFLREARAILEGNR